MEGAFHFHYNTVVVVVHVEGVADELAAVVVALHHNYNNWDLEHVEVVHEDSEEQI